MTSTDPEFTLAALLTVADSLVEQGRALEAIDRLTASSRERRSPELDRRLVELRHAAFAELSKQPGRPTWPPVYPDPFPHERGLPSADAHQLSADLLGGAIVNHGCLHVRGLLPDEPVRRLRDQIERVFEARERLADGTPPHEAAPWFVPFEVGQTKAEGFGRDLFVRTVDSPGALFELVDLFREKGVTQAVTDYFGERPAMIANKWVLRRSPSGDAGTDFHQDGAFLGDHIRTIDCWIALSNCGPGTGRPGIDLIPRRFERILPSGAGAAFPWSLAEDVVLASTPDVALCSPVFEAGDALFFDERLPHRTSYGPDLTTRYAVESWFVAPSSYPDKHVPVVL